jgi:hypothetical protein
MILHHFGPNLKDSHFLLRKLRRFVALIACVVLCSSVNVQQGNVEDSALVPFGLSRV